MNIPTIIERSFVDENKEKLGWKGNGTENEPFIIDDSIDLPVDVIFKTEDLYINMKDIDINIVILDKCQNIIIEDSIISYLKLKSCENIVIKNNLIRKVKNSFGKNIIIENNRIHRFFNIRKFTIYILLLSLVAGGIAILSYSIAVFLLRDLMLLLLVIGLIVLGIEIIGKRSKRFLPKNFKKNEFISVKSKNDVLVGEEEETLQSPEKNKDLK